MGRLGLAVRLGPFSKTSSAPTFDPLSTTPTIWLDPSDLTTMRQTGTRAAPGAAAAVDSPVGLIMDKSGNNFDPAQATAGKLPILRKTNGFNELQFDGVDDFLSVFFTLNQPCEIIAAFRTITWSNNTVFVFGANSAGLLNIGASPQQALFANNVQPTVVDQTIGTNFVATFTLNGASSSLQINNATTAVADAGPTHMGGIVLGATASGTACANIACLGLVAKQGGFSASERASLKTYMGAKAGLSL